MLKNKPLSIHGCKQFLLILFSLVYSLTHSACRIADTRTWVDTLGTSNFSVAINANYLPDTGLTKPHKYVWYQLKIENTTGYSAVLQLSDVFYEIECYVPDFTGKYHLFKSGYKLPVNDRYLKADQPSIYLPSHHTAYTVYVKTKCFREIGSVIHLVQDTTWFNNEVYRFWHFGIFFGTLLIVLAYNISFFLLVKEHLYLYYAGYMVCLGFFYGAVFGIINYFHFILHPTFGIYSVPFSGMTIFMLLYTTRFFSHLPQWVIYTLYSGVGLKILFFVGLLAGISLAYNTLADITILLIPLAVCIMAASQKDRSAYLFGIGLLLMLYGYIYHTLYVYSIPVLTYVGIAEMIVFSIALSYRYRILKRARENVQTELIQQMEENANIREQVTEQLEKIVQDRTAIIMRQAEDIAKMNELLKQDNFKLKSDVEILYKATAEDNTLSFEIFKTIYPDEATCYSLVEELKWKNGFSCKRCNNKGYSKGNMPYSRRCSKCGYIESVMVDTIFNNVRFSILKAFYIAALAHSGKEIHFTNLSREIDLRLGTCLEFYHKVKGKMIGTKQNNKKGNWTEYILLSTKSI